MSNSMVNSLNTRLRMTGLSSGLDVDTMVEQMLQADKAKIDKVKQDKQILSWKKDDYRTIIGSMKTFTDTYMNVLNSSTNMRSPSIYNKFTSKSTDSEVVTAAGSGTVNSLVHTIKVREIASVSQAVSTSAISKGMTGSVLTVDASHPISINDYNNSFNVNLNGSSKTIKLDNKEYTDLDDLISNLNQKLTLAYGGSITASNSGGAIKLTGQNASDSITLTPGTSSDNVLKDILKVDGTGSGKAISFPLTIHKDQGFVVSYVENKITYTRELEWTADKTYNSISELTSDLNSRFGNLGLSGKITADSSSGALSINKSSSITSMTLTEGTNNEDIMGRLGFSAGVTNKISIYDTVEQVGNKLAASGAFTFTDNKLTLTINGKTITVNKTDSLNTLLTAVNSSDAGVTMSYDSFNDKFTIKSKVTGYSNITLSDNGNFFTRIGLKDSTLSNTLHVNNLGVGTDLGDMAATPVTITGGSYFNVSIVENGVTTTKTITLDAGTYNNSTDLASAVQSKLDTAGLTGKVSVSGAGNKLTFTKGAGVSSMILNDANATAGQDALFDLDGIAGSRATNNFTVDGVTYTLLKKSDTTQTVTLTRDVDSTYNAIKTFVEKYNELLTSVNSKTSEKRPRSGGNTGSLYLPLTDEQRKEMSEDDIKAWEEKAKKGLLRNDDLLSSLASNLRSKLYESISGVSGGLYSIGITTGSYTEKGKLTIDETKLKEAITNNPDLVTNIFSKQSTTSYSVDMSHDERKTRDSENGIVYRIYDVIQDYIRTAPDQKGNKGLLLERAGLAGTTTDYDNYLVEQMDDLDERLESLADKYEDKQERLYKKFTAMETAMSKLNSQQNWLTQQLGGGQ